MEVSTGEQPRAVNILEEDVVASFAHTANEFLPKALPAPSPSHMGKALPGPRMSEVLALDMAVPTSVIYAHPGHHSLFTRSHKVFTAANTEMSANMS